VTEPAPQRPVPGPPRPVPGPVPGAPAAHTAHDAAATGTAPSAGAAPFAGTSPFAGTAPSVDTPSPFADLDARPVAEHVAVYEAEHERLQRELSTIDQL
jgi:hypothetical protein